MVEFARNYPQYALIVIHVYVPVLYAVNLPEQFFDDSFVPLFKAAGFKKQYVFKVLH
jgi:hypothetical protein